MRLMTLSFKSGRDFFEDPIARIMIVPDLKLTLGIDGPHGPHRLHPRSDRSILVRDGIRAERERGLREREAVGPASLNGIWKSSIIVRILNRPETRRTTKVMSSPKSRSVPTRRISMGTRTRMSPAIMIGGRGGRSPQLLVEILVPVHLRLRSRGTRAPGPLPGSRAC